jgi:steroid delta-isomerase-like uncharacterized protein
VILPGFLSCANLVLSTATADFKNPLTGARMRHFKQVLSIVVFVTAASISASSQSNGPDVSAQNAAIVRAHHELMNKGDWKAALNNFSEDTKNFGNAAGRDGVAMILQDVWATFPDFRLEIVDLVAKDDWVVVRCRESGTHLGVGKLPVNGGLLVDVPATHRHFEVEATHWWKVRDGKIVDHYGVRDDLGMMEQLGLLVGPKR